ncbi:MAG: hypothetical protein MK212_00040 [Saprospiraceae bacterium]|nr:hypothetical protein [Saprospiraceae bacterium]
MYKVLIVLFLFSFVGVVDAQDVPLLKNKKEMVYRFRNKTDSIPKSIKEWQYDKEGRLIYKQYYMYSMRSNDPPNTLHREEKTIFVKDDNLLEQSIVNYGYGGKTEPKSEMLRTWYLKYAAKDEDSKPRLWQKLDNFMEIIKEDTLTYDEEGKLVERCLYNYKGSTSLFCDKYFYNKKGKRVRWKTYNRWTTININSKVKQRNSKRRDYRYSYNSKGQHIKSKGKYYKTKYKQEKKYDKNGSLTFFQTTETRRSKSPQKMRETTGKKYYQRINQITEKFENGNRVYYQEIKNSNEVNRTEKVYEGDLEKSYTMWYKGKTWEEVTYSYNDQGIRTGKELQRYTQKGKPHYQEKSVYDTKGQIMKTIRIANNKEISRLEYEYNTVGDLLSKTMFVQNNVKFEKTMYIYTYD